LRWHFQSCKKDNNYKKIEFFFISEKRCFDLESSSDQTEKHAAFLILKGLVTDDEDRIGDNSHLYL